MLVGQQPSAVSRGVVLADGVDHYRVEDEAVKGGEKWFELANISSPELELRRWFRLADMSELFFDKKPGGKQRRYGVRRGAG